MTANRIDANQPEIVSGLRDTGYTVQLLNAVKCGCPDILVGGEMPCPLCHGWYAQNRLIEIKTVEGKLTVHEKVWHQDWQGQVAIARTISEALHICGR